MGDCFAMGEHEISGRLSVGEETVNSDCGVQLISK
jgi:hypothetical protein